MKIALIADIHGNLAAFEAVLAEIEREGPDQVVCLGDVAMSGPQPHEVLVRLRALGWPVVMGNSDAWLLDPQRSPDANARTQRIDDVGFWNAAQLDDDDRAFLASFQPTVAVDLGAAGNLLCFHGSPRSYDDIIFATTPDEEIDGMFAGHDGQVYAGGHTHTRLLRSIHGREIVNPGSVGLAYESLADDNAHVLPWAEFAVLTTVDGAIGINVAFRRVPYDQGATVRAMHERGMPHAEWWSEGWG